MKQDNEMIEILFLNNTLLSKEEIRKILNFGWQKAKLRLSFEIVSIFYGYKKAKEVEKSWILKNKKL